MTELAIVKGKAYKVKDGDSLQSIASNAGITWQELARFNWGTDDPDRINTFLRNRVGCRKKTSDGKNYIFTSKDDPGIIHVPQNMPEKLFGSDSVHSIIVKPAEKKTYIPAKCLVKFRPASEWKGEFGFDWLRIGDRGTEKYEAPLLDGGYDGSKPNGLTAAEATQKIKEEYVIIETVVKGNPDYRVPHLNIFPKGLQAGGETTEPSPPYEAKLDMFINVEDQAPEALKIKVGDIQDDDDLSDDLVIFGKDKHFEFELTAGKEIPKAVGTQKATLKISCVKEFSEKKEINIYTLTKDAKGWLRTYIAGKVIACPNAKSYRKVMKFILVPVWSDSSGTGLAVKGSFTTAEKTNLRNALFQALIEGDLSEDPGVSLDVSNNDDFLQVTSSGRQGKFYTAQKSGGLNQDHPDFYPTVRKLFLKEPGNDKYKHYFTVFAFGERPYDLALGQVQGIGVHNLIVFPDRDDCTSNHEVLHGLGLLHSFKETDKNKANVVIKIYPPDKGAKFTFQQGKTDNVMDYTYDSSALITWHWQWKMINH